MDERRRLMMGQGGGDTGAIDLSMVDNAGNVRSSMTTANCYLVHAAGDYKLPLVYGNAIKNGAVNTVAFNPGGNASSTYTTQFINHANTPISGPWITKSTSGSGVNKGMGLSAASAELLWQDRAGLITSVSVNGDYLNFTVGSFGGGNALIAVKNGSGTILWSWHIWATEDDLSNTTVVATGSHNYTVAPVNLGWVPTGGDGKQGYCTYYQWGRKDPFIPCNGTANDDNTNKTVYNISGSTVTGITYEQNNSATIGTNIQYPTKHYYNSSTGRPVSTKYCNMWDAQTNNTNYYDNVVATATKKTIYDPCPPGFCVPTDNLWYYFGDEYGRRDYNWDYYNGVKTWTLNGASIYFPAAGLRASNSGALRDVGPYGYGYCWSATNYGETNSRCMKFNPDHWYWSNSMVSAGIPVRPVAEE